MENNQDNTLDLKQIMSKCLDSPGYLLFAAIRTPKKDGNGAEIIDYQYRRYHLNLEDSKQAGRELQEFVKKEIKDLIDQQIKDETSFAD